MAILEGDIVFLKSQVMDDAPEGGGLATGVQVVDGVSNNLFPSIPQLSWAYGAVEVRKVFPAVLTDNTDNYAGAMVYVAEAPADPNVHCLLFTTKSWSDTQLAAKNKLESYIGMGPETRWHLYGNHLVDQRSLQLQGLKNVPTPSIGDVLALVKTADASQYQYVRITRVVARLVDQVFTDGTGDYLRDVLTLEISDPLRISFTAPAVVRFTNDYNTAPTKIFSGLAVDAGSYRGVQSLTQSAALGDLVIRVPSLYGHLIPSALAEAPIVDARCVNSIEAVIPINGAARLSFGAALATAPGQLVTRYFGSGIARGSISVVLGGVTLTDDSNGALVATGGFTGSVDYANGAVSLAKSTGYTGNATYSAAPAASVAMAGHSDAIAISVGNRAYTYVRSLSPAPAPGSVVISYLVLGQWYSLYDDGAGNLTGDEGVGVGTVNYVTGGTILTLGALPDANSQILFSWATPAHYESQVGSNVFDLPAFQVDIPGGAIQPGSLTLTYPAGGMNRTIADNGQGLLNGDGNGWVDYAQGRIRAMPAFLPDANSNVVTAYTQGAALTVSFAAAGVATPFDLGHPVLPGSLTLEFEDSRGGIYRVRDDGQGNLEYIPGSADFSLANNIPAYTTTTLASTSGIGGSINYSTGSGVLLAAPTLSTATQTSGFYWGGAYA